MSGADAPSGTPPDGAGRGGLRTRDDNGRTLVHDPVRRRWVALTPEERVRQGLLVDLVALGYPVGLLAVEKGLAYRGLSWRADVVAYGRDGRARLLAECKAPGVAVGQKTFDQLARYNAVLDAPALVVDNGAARYCCVRDGAGWRFVDALPAFGG